MAQQMSRLKKTVIILSVAALSEIGAGIAFAYWTSTGTGVGEATTGEAALFLIAVDASEDPPLAPGGPGQTIAFTVTNSGSGTQLLSQVTVRAGLENGDPWVPEGDCLAMDYQVSISSLDAVGQVGPAGIVDGEVTVLMLNTDQNQDDCRGQVVPLYFTASSEMPAG